MKSFQCLTNLALWALLTAGLSFNGFTPVRTIHGKADKITTDNLGNLYVIKGNTVQKYNGEGSFLAEYTRKSIDRFTDIDASDPLKVLLFSKSSAEIIRLDNQLALQGNPTILFNAGCISPALACNSYDNGCWVWEMSVNEIVRVNHQGIIDQRTENLSTLIAPEYNLSHLLEKDFLLYAADPMNGIFIFDRYGNWVRSIPVKNVSSFQLSGNHLICFLQDHLVLYDIRTLQENTITLPEKNPVNARIEGKNVYIHQNDSITLYLSNHPL